MRNRSASLILTILLLCPTVPMQAAMKVRQTSVPSQTSAQTATPSQASPLSPEKFSFTQIDLELLEQSNLLDKRFDKEGLVYPADSVTSAYVEHVGQRIVARNPTPERVVWSFRVLRDPLANAFALPNGSIYVNTGLLAILESEAQLAGVLAHEATHVRNRHSYQANRSYRKKMVALNIVSIAGAWNPFGGAVGLSIAILSTAMPVITYATIIGYSRDLEREADREAVHILAVQGYDPHEMANSFRMLQKDFEGAQVKLFYADHPQLEDRIAAVDKIIAADDKLIAAEKLTKGTKLSDQATYITATEESLQQDVRLAIGAGNFRTATAISKHLVESNPHSSENAYLLAESYRTLGPRAADLTPAELTESAKKKANRKRSKLTPEEEDTELMRTTTGTANWQQNQMRALEMYTRALEMDTTNAEAHRGLGLLYERAQKPQEAVAAYRKYLELRRDASDRKRIERRINALEKPVSN